MVNHTNLDFCYMLRETQVMGKNLEIIISNLFLVAIMSALLWFLAYRK